MSHPTNPALQRLIALANQQLAGVIQVQPYDYASCYLWHDRPLYNDFGEQIQLLKGDTIYLYNQSTSPGTDLFHELGHFVGRTFNLIGHRDNGYTGSWQQAHAMLIAQVAEQRHWSDYLNAFARSQAEFRSNAASELWAELFMLWHLYPTRAESRLLDDEMSSLEKEPACCAIRQLAQSLQFEPTSES
ncbi:MAG: hypothetical protein AAF404_14125 [Pseudomonadota bacterium]